MGKYRLLINQLCLTEFNSNVITAKKKFYQEIGLKVFLAGLREPLGPIVRAQSPETLKEALRLCAEETNYSYVRNPFKTHTPPIPPPKPLFHPTPFRFPQHNPMPRPPIKAFQNNFHPQQRQSFQYPGPSFHKPIPNSNPFRNQSYPFRSQQNQNPHNPFRQSFTPQNAFAPKNIHLPKPVPMDVDSSVRSRAVNYMNRPNFHLEHDPHNYGNYFQQEDGNYYNQYPETLNENYYNHESTEYDPVEYAVETQEPTAASDGSETKQDEPQQIDDLNFQMAYDQAEPT